MRACKARGRNAVHDKGQAVMAVLAGKRKLRRDALKALQRGRQHQAPGLAAGGQREHFRAEVQWQGSALGVEVEKPGLLPLRPDEDVGDVAARGAGQRRPADVWVVQWGLHGPAAFDLAVTSGLRGGGILADTAVETYEAHRRAHLQTERHCVAERLQFLPLIAEACSGGWGPTAAATWRTLGGLIAARSGDTPSAETDRLLNRAKPVVALHPVPPARAAARMVTELISHTIAEWACSVRKHDWQTETKLRHDAEQARRDRHGAQEPR